MNNLTLTVILMIGFVLCEQISNIRIEKMTLKKSEETILNSIKEKNRGRAKEGLAPFSKDGFLMEMAQIQAQKLAQQSKITALKINTNLKFTANIFKIEGLKSGKLVGKKAFYTNLKPMNKVTVVRMSKPYVGNDFVDNKQLFAIGYGQAMRQNGDIYVVIIFLTNQKAIQEHFLDQPMPDIDNSTEELTEENNSTDDETEEENSTEEETEDENTNEEEMKNDKTNNEETKEENTDENILLKTIKKKATN